MRIKFTRQLSLVFLKVRQTFLPCLMHTHLYRFNYCTVVNEWSLNVVVQFFYHWAFRRWEMGFHVSTFAFAIFSKKRNNIVSLTELNYCLLVFFMVIQNFHAGTLTHIERPINPDKSKRLSITYIYECEFAFQMAFSTASIEYMLFLEGRLACQNKLIYWTSFLSPTDIHGLNYSEQDLCSDN